MVSFDQVTRVTNKKMIETADIAVVSFDKFNNGGDADKRAVAKQLYNAFSTVGWVYLTDHGIPQERVDETFGLVRNPIIASNLQTDFSGQNLLRPSP
jgi:hypothetical protein